MINTFRAKISFYETKIRPTLRQILARICLGRNSPDKFVAVVGLPRSGTSWLAKAISLSKNVSYYFEPEHNLGPEYCYKYLPADKKDDTLYKHIEKSLAGRIFDEYTICEQDFKDIFFQSRADTMLVKWVRFPLCLDWIANNFPDLKVIQIIRHPVPQFLSWAKKGWTPAHNLQFLLNQAELRESQLKPYLSIIEKADNFWEQAGLFWGITAKMQLQSHRRGWYLIEHEWLCLDPENRIRWLLNQLDLNWNSDIAEFLSPYRKKSGPGYGAPRDSRKEVNKWRNLISSDDFERLSETLQIFNLPFYPNLDPERSLFMTDVE